MVGPSGTYVLTTRSQNGSFKCEGDRWSRSAGMGGVLMTAFGGNQLGNPTYDTAKGLQQTRQLLRDSIRKRITTLRRLESSYLRNNVHLQVGQCSYPATYGKELRKVITRSKGKLTTPRIARIREVLDQVLGRQSAA